MTIGQRIRLRGEELNMSQDELAKRIGYKSRSSINKIELDLYSLRQAKIKAIADALDTTPSYIMGWDEEKEVESSLEKVKAALEQEDSKTAEIIKLILDLPESKQDEALNYIRYLSASEGK